MNPTTLNVLIWAGVSLGVLGGLAGGVIGTFNSIKNTGGARERAFMIRCLAVMWVVLVPWLVAYFVVPRPWQIPLLLGFIAALPLWIRHVNRRQREIRLEEEKPK